MSYAYCIWKEKLQWATGKWGMEESRSNHDKSTCSCRNQKKLYCPANSVLFLPVSTLYHTLLSFGWNDYAVLNIKQDSLPPNTDHGPLPCSTWHHGNDPLDHGPDPIPPDHGNGTDYSPGSDSPPNHALELPWNMALTSPPPPPEQNDRHLWKHCLPHTKDYVRAW